MSAQPTPFASAAYQRYLEEGGQFEANLPAADLKFDADFEAKMGAAKLADGFDLLPTPVAFMEKNYGTGLIYGNEATRAILYTYQHGGKVTYYRLPNGTYRVLFEYQKPNESPPEEQTDK